MFSKRIKELGDMIEPNSHVIDVGCDHGLLDIYLVEKNIGITCLATDISQNALNSAVDNIKKNNVGNYVKTMQTNGLNNINIQKNDVIVISGMGTNTIIDIITPYLDLINHLIIQSNRDVETLRLFMFNHGFKIINEKVVYDGRYYIFIEFAKGNSNYQEEDIWLGPVIKASKNLEYFEFLLTKEKKLEEKMPTNDLRKNEVIKRIKYLNKIINC